MTMDTQHSSEACFVPMPEPNPLRKSTIDIPEGRDLTWRDSYFDYKVEDTVAVFDRDYVGAGAYGAFFRACWFAVPPVIWASLWIFTDSMDTFHGTLPLVCFAVLLADAVLTREGEGQLHLAVTTKGIRYDFKYRDEFVARTIPFEDFDECVVLDATMVSLFCCIRGRSLKRVALTGIRWDYSCDSLFFFSTRLYDMRFSDIWEPRLNWRRSIPFLYYPLVGLERAEEFVNLVMAMKQRKKQERATENPTIV